MNPRILVTVDDTDASQTTDQEPMLNLKQVNEENEDGYTGTSEDLDADEHIDVGKLSESYHDTEMGRLVLLAA